MMEAEAAEDEIEGNTWAEDSGKKKKKKAKKGSGADVVAEAEAVNKALRDAGKRPCRQWSPVLLSLIHS